MTDLMRQILASKAKERKRLAALSFEEKLVIMEMMRDRAIMFKNYREAKKLANPK